MSIWTTVCEWFEPLGEMLWLNALVIVPLAVLAAVISSIPRFRPVTRHGAWLVALVWCLLPPVLPAFRVQIDDHTTHTPLSVPHSADAERVASPLLSVGSPIRFNANRSGEIGESNSPHPDQAPGPLTVADAKSPGRLPKFDTKRTTPPDASPEAIWSAGRTTIDPSNDSDLARPTGLLNRDRSKRPRVFIFAPYWSSLDLLDVDRFHLAQEGDVECVSKPPCESPLPWQPDGDLAFYPPTKPAESNAPNGIGPDALSDADALIGVGAPSAMNARDNTDAVNNLKKRGESHVRVESNEQDGSGVGESIQNDSWQNHWYVRPLGGWVQGLLEVRDAIGRLPVMPSQVWLGGMLLTALMFGAFAFDGRRRIRGAYPAPPEVCDLARFAAERMGLSRSPRVMLVDCRMSPMIWCGRQPTLVLPADLWDELDDAGRHTVIFHELAHLLRRDHWVCRLSIVATCLYWWHPLVWWVRKRVHEEAEMCCDAWVIWHLPSGRRAYADTLLRARQYLSCPSTLSPALSMSAANNEKQKFARRLTMIMTQRSKPHRGSASVVLLAALCLAGWAATPAVSTQPSAAPSEDSVAVAPSVESVPSAPAAVATAPIAAAAPIESTVLAVGPTSPIVVAAPLAFAPTGADDDQEDAKSNRELSKRMAELQRHVEELSRKVEKLAETAGRSAERAAERADRLVSPRPSRLEGAGDAPFGLVTSSSGKVISRKYSMPEGKLQAFTHLMSRDDVSIMISPGDNDITIQGTAEQHAIIEGFISIINRERKEETQAYELSEGKLKDLTELMVRNDVPIRVHPGDEQIGVIGTPAEQAIFKAFIELIRPDNVDMHNLGAARDALRVHGYAAALSDEKDAVARQKIEEVLAKTHWQQGQLHEHENRLQAHQHQLHTHRDKLLREQSQCAQEAERAQIELMLRSKEQQHERIEESKRAYNEAMKKLEKDLARQKMNQAQ